MNKAITNFTKMPIMYFSDDHPNSLKLRNQLVKNFTKISECNITDLETTFFSDDNIDLINKQLILSVWKHTNKQYKIGYQDKKKLIIVMQYIFIEYCKHLPFDLKGQIKELNCRLISDILPTIVTNLEQKMAYLQFIERKSELLSLPINTSINKTLPTKNSTI